MAIAVDPDGDVITQFAPRPVILTEAQAEAWGIDTDPEFIIGIDPGTEAELIRFYEENEEAIRDSLDRAADALQRWLEDRKRRRQQSINPFAVADPLLLF